MQTNTYGTGLNKTAISNYLAQSKVLANWKMNIPKLVDICDSVLKNKFELLK